MDTLKKPRYAATAVPGAAVKSPRSGITARTLERYKRLKSRLKVLEERLLDFKVPPKEGYIWMVKTSKGMKRVKRASQRQVDRNVVYEVALADFESRGG